MSAKYVCVWLCVCMCVWYVFFLLDIFNPSKSRVANRPGRDSGNASHGGKGETRVLLVQVSATWLMADHGGPKFWTKNGVRIPMTSHDPWPSGCIEVPGEMLVIKLLHMGPFSILLGSRFVQHCRIWHDMAWWKIVWLEPMANRDFHVRFVYTGRLPKTVTHGFSTSHSYTAWVLETNRQAGCWLWRGSGWWWGSLPRALQMSLGLERRLWHHWSG